MRWRVGRKPTWRSIAFTSCHGQPVSSERSVAGGGATAGLAEGNTMILTWLVVECHRQPRRADEKPYVCNIYALAARCNSFANSAAARCYRAVPAGSSSAGARFRRLCPLASVCYESAHGNSASRPAERGYRANGHQASQLRIRGSAGLRPRRTVRAGQRPVAAAADADVRPHLRNRGAGRRARQGHDPRRARREAGPLVLPLPLQGRSGDAGLPRPRRAVADGRIFPRLAGFAGQGPRARSGRS